MHMKTLTHYTKRSIHQPVSSEHGKWTPRISVLLTPLLLSHLL